MRFQMKRLIAPCVTTLALLACWTLLVQADPATLRPYSLAVDTGVKTAAATAGAATLNKSAGVITSEALVTAAGATYTLTLTNTVIAATDQVFASVAYGTATTGAPVIVRVQPASGSVAITVQNVASAAALNGTIKIAFLDLKN